LGLSGLGLYRYDLCLELRAPVLIGGGAASRFGVDTLQMRDADGRVIIPDTHLKGVLRAAWEALAADGVSAPISVDDAFGRRGADVRTDEVGDTLDPLDRGCLMFRDLVADDIGTTGRITRVALDDETGAAAEAQLQSVEMIAEPGAVIAFRGSLLAWLDGAQTAAALQVFLETALAAVFAIGKAKTVGYGQIVKRHVSAPVALPATVSVSKGGTRFSYRFGLDKRLLTDTSRPDANTLVGAATVPGGVLKGALAEKLLRLGRDPMAAPIGPVLSRMVISHAELASTIPKAESDHWRDEIFRLDTVALAPGDRSAGQSAHSWDSGLVLSRDPAGPLPDFKGDEKGTPSRCPETPGALARLPNLVRDTRTRNAIDADTGTAEDGALFVQSSVHPRFKKRPIEWRGTVTWPGDPQGGDYDTFLDLLTHFAGGLVPVGKTASATVTGNGPDDYGIAVEDIGPVARQPLKAGQRFEVIILSPALMLRERHLRSESAFAEALQSYWTVLGNGAFHLAKEPPEPLDPPGSVRGQSLDFYCRVEVRAGYQALRHPFFGQDVLEPFVLTQPGSVFRLEIVDPASAAQRLWELETYGLPVACWETDGGNGEDRLKVDPEPDFRVCPFVPQNGFGRIAASRFEVAT